jgi:hypothetical protein
MAVSKRLAVRLWLFDVDTRVQALVTSCEIHGGRNDTSSNFSPPVIIPPLPHTHLSLLRKMRDFPDQAARCHVLGLKNDGFVAWPPTVGRLQSKEATSFRKAIAVRSVPLVS